MKMKKEIILLLIALGITASCFYSYAREGSGTIFPITSGTFNPSSGSSPTVSITNPLNGSTVNGLINILASASSSVGVQSMKLEIDGQSVKTNSSTPIITTMTITYSWNTSAYSDGSHTINASAMDNPGNKGYTMITVNVQNTPPAPPSPVNTFILVGLVGAGIVGIYIVARIVSAHGKKVGGKPRGKPGQVKEFNPQPEPPGKPKEFNPQPEPPGKPGDYKEFNPQPEPPGKNVKLKKKKKLMKR